MLAKFIPDDLVSRNYIFYLLIAVIVICFLIEGISFATAIVSMTFCNMMNMNFNNPNALWLSFIGISVSIFSKVFADKFKYKYSDKPSYAIAMKKCIKRGMWLTLIGIIMVFI